MKWDTIFDLSRERIRQIETMAIGIFKDSSRANHNDPILRIEVSGVQHSIECRNLNHDDGQHNRREKAMLNLMT